MILAAAQTRPFDEDIEKNLSDHYEFIRLAAEKDAKLIVFPEMSLTGYLREQARTLYFIPNDKRLSKLKQMAADHKMIIIAGAPLKIDSQLYISSFVLMPDCSEMIYTKHFLHEGESEVFVPGFEYNPLIRLGDELISLAICADIDNPVHAANAKKRKSTLFIASIFFSKKGISGGHSTLRTYAKQHSLNVLMSNYCGKSWELDAGGMSAFWDNKGNQLCGLNPNNTGLLLVEKRGNEWISLNSN